jgi:hypothetical protein
MKLGAVVSASSTKSHSSFGPARRELAKLFLESR